MPFIETIFFKDDKKKLKEINKLISLKISNIFDIQGNTITIYNNFIDKKNFNHNFINGSSEKRIFIKISGLRRSVTKKKKLSNAIIKDLKKIIKVKHPTNIAIYFYDRSKADIYHGY